MARHGDAPPAVDPADFPPEELTIPPRLVDHPATRANLSRYYAEVAWLDAQVGAVLDLIDRCGQRENTLFLFLTERAMAGPDAGTRNDAMVQYVDLLPGLIEAAGGKAPSGLDGRSCWPVLTGRARRHARYV